MYEFLRKVPLFSDLADDDLETISHGMRRITLEAGEELFAEGAAGDKAYLIESGELDIIKQSGNQEMLLAVRRPGEVIGEVALLEEAPRMASVRARGPTSLIAIKKEALDELLSSSPAAARALLRTVLGRLRGTEAQLRQSEKMAQLGTLTAGMAHELNNPASAVRRGASQLRESLPPYVRASVTLSQLGVERPSPPPAGSGAGLDALARSDREMEIEEWLEANGVVDAWELASDLVRAGYDVARLEQLQAKHEPDALTAVLHWEVTAGQVQALLDEIGHGAARISEIVQALKSYSYLDQAPVQTVDVHASLSNTLAMLRPRLAGIDVVREFAESLPLIRGYGRELNQVWTNLIDNAADALNGRGAITVRTHQEGNWIVVEVEDDGPGIPEEVQQRVFDAFFTTKPPGAGAGLGLNISYNTVVYKHNGLIELRSRPGMTRFTVWLPLDFEKPGPLPAGSRAGPAGATPAS